MMQVGITQISNGWLVTYPGCQPCEKFPQGETPTVIHYDKWVFARNAIDKYVCDHTE